MSVTTVCPICQAPIDEHAGVCGSCARPIDDRSVKLDHALRACTGERYRLVRRIGSGAFGEVFRARDTALDRDVAIKQVRLDTFTGPEQDDMQQRSLREAKTAAKLLHPNIVTVYDVIQIVDSTLIIMEFVDGVTLESRLTEAGHLDFDEMLDLMTQTAAGLEHAHQHGIVHRDIKPANLMIDVRGCIRITDFGIAKAETSASLTTTGSVLGTPDYMSPEQPRGQSKLDGRADLFSLGCVTYECLSGRKPFRGQSAIETIMQIVNQPAPSLDHRAMNLRVNVQSALDKALAKKAEDRFASAGAFIEALKAAPVLEAPTQPEPEIRTPTPSADLPSAPAPPLITSRPPGSTTSFDIGLQGTLATTGLADVVREIHGETKTGILHLQHEAAAKRLYFRDGGIVFANSDVESDRLGQFLIRIGVIDHATYESTCRAMRDSGKRFGVTLVGLGTLDHERLNSLVNDQIREIIFSVFRWSSGNFGFEAIRRPVEEDIALKLSTEQILLEGCRLTDSEEAIRKAIGSMERIAELTSASILDDKKLTLTSPEGFVLSCVDGSTSISDLVTISALEERETLRCVYGLLSTGILKLSEPKSIPTGRISR